MNTISTSYYKKNKEHFLDFQEMLYKLIMDGLVHECH